MTVFRHKNIAIQLAILLTFIVRSFIPLGFMPGKTAANDGQLFPMVICSAGGSSTVYLTADKLPAAPEQQAPHDDTAQHDHAPCVFSGTFNLAVGTLPAVLPLPLALAAAEHISPDAALTPETSAPAAYFAQGPPALLQA